MDVCHGQEKFMKMDMDCFTFKGNIIERIELGKEFGLSHVMIQHIKHGRYWRHLDNQIERNK